MAAELHVVWYDPHSDGAHGAYIEPVQQQLELEIILLRAHYREEQNHLRLVFRRTAIADEALAWCIDANAEIAAVFVPSCVSANFIPLMNTALNHQSQQIVVRTLTHNKIPGLTEASLLRSVLVGPGGLRRSIAATAEVRAWASPRAQCSVACETR
jgi:hypothetical protein